MSKYTYKFAGDIKIGDMMLVRVNTGDDTSVFRDLTVEAIRKSASGRWLTFALPGGTLRRRCDDTMTVVR